MSVCDEVGYQRARELYRSGQWLLARDSIVSSEGYQTKAECRTLLALIAFQMADITNLCRHVRCARWLGGDRAMTWNIFGASRQRSGADQRAIVAFERALRIESDFHDAHFNLGCSALRLARWERACVAFSHAVALAPASMAAHFNLGLVQLRLQRYAEACVSLRTAKALGGAASVINYYLAIAQGESIDRSPVDYVRDIYDRDAAQFEQHLTKSLGYDTPQRLGGMLDRLGGRHPDTRKVLDLGCGTGLVGRALRKNNEQWTGVDLSAGMLEQARRCGLYETLVRSDMVSFLADSQVEYDLIVCVDALIYFGALDEVMVGMASCIRRGGHVLFSVEALRPETDSREAPGWQVQGNGRFKHDGAYVGDVLRAAGLTLLCMEHCRTRWEDRIEVMAWLVIAGR